VKESDFSEFVMKELGQGNSKCLRLGCFAVSNACSKLQGDYGNMGFVGGLMTLKLSAKSLNNSQQLVTSLISQERSQDSTGTSMAMDSQSMLAVNQTADGAEVLAALEYLSMQKDLVVATS